MSQKIIFKYGKESNIPSTKEPGQLLFAIKSDGTGNIYFDKDASTRIKMGLGTEGGTINGTLLFQGAKKKGHLKLYGSDEGGNIQIQGPNNTHYWEMDALHDNHLRLYCYDINKNEIYGYWSLSSDKSTTFPGNLSVNGYVTSGDNMYANYMIARRDNSTAEAACVARNNNGEVKLTVENSRGIWDTTGGKWVLNAANGSTNWYANLYKAEASYEFYAHNSSESGHFRGGVDGEGGYWEVKSKNGRYSYQFDDYNDTGWRLYAWDHETNKYAADITFDTAKNRLEAYKLRLNSTADAAANQITDVALTIGPEDSQHLIIDHNEILSKTNATTTGDLHLQGLQIQHSGKIVAGTWNASTIAVRYGGTGATTADGACANIGAVKKSGDTMTGTLKVANNLQIYGDAWRSIGFETADGKDRASMMISNTNVIHFNVRETGATYADRYKLPNPTAGKTAESWYDILTTKNAVTVAQGGTGATTASGALTNLGAVSLETFNNRRVGGRNLLKCLPLSKLPFGTGDSSGSDTKGTVSYDAYSKSLCVVNNNSNLRLWLYSDMPVKPNETYTISCWAASNKQDPTAGEPYQFQIIAKLNSGSLIHYSKDSTNFKTFSHADTSGNGWGWKIISQTFTTPNDCTKISVAFRTGYDYQNYTNKFFIKNFKIEQSPVYTDWCPAPEELLTIEGGSTYESLQIGTGKSRHLNLWAGDDGVTKIGHQDASWLETNAIYLYDTHTYFKKPLQIVNEQFWESGSNGDKYGIDMRNSDIMNANGIYFQDDANAMGEGLNFYRGTNTWDSLLASGGKLYFAPNRAKNSVGTRYEVYHSGGATIPISKGGTGATTIDNAILNLGLAAPAYDIPAANASEWEQKARAYILEKAPTYGVKSFNIGWQGASFGSGIVWKSGGEINALVLNKGATGGFKFWRHISGNWVEDTALAVTAGGTGATTAAQARKNLAVPYYAKYDAGNLQTGAGNGSAWITYYGDDGTSYNQMDLGKTATSFTKPVNVASGGTGATTADGACTNLGAVKKSGDTMTGCLWANGGFAVKGDHDICILSNTDHGYFLKDLTGSIVVGGMRIDSSTNKIRFEQKMVNQNAYERYYLPAPASLTSNKDYTILTTKNAGNGLNSYVTEGGGISETVDVFTLAPGVYHLENTSSTDKNYPIAESRATVFVYGQFRAGTAATDGYPNGYWVIRVLYASGKEYINYRYWSAWKGWKQVHNGFNAVSVAQGGTGATTASGARANLGALSNAGDTANGNYTINGSLTIQNTSTQKISLNNTNANGESSIGFYNAGTLKWVCGIGCGGSDNTFALWNNNLGRNNITVDSSNGETAFTGAIIAKNNSSSGYAKMWNDGEGGNIQIRSKSGTYDYQWDAYQDNHMRFFAQNAAGSVIASWNYWPHSGCFATKAININGTGDITGITYSDSAPAGSAGHIWLKPI